MPVTDARRARCPPPRPRAVRRPMIHMPQPEDEATAKLATRLTERSVTRRADAAMKGDVRGQVTPATATGGEGPARLDSYR